MSVWLAGLRAILADPFYRWEVRRYWTWRRFLAVTAVLMVWWALAFLLALNLIRGEGASAGTAAAVSVWLGLLCRLPLALVAVTGGALAVVPERASGELEQLILTPMDPWRLCRARYAARMSGILVLWALAGGLMLVAWPPALNASLAGFVRTGDPVFDPARWLEVCLLLLVLHLDWGMMLLIDGANGLRFSATSRSTPVAVVRACLRSFVTIPVVLGFAAVSGATAAGMVTVLAGAKDVWWPWLAGAVVFRLLLGLTLVWDDLARARRGAERIFFEPEAAA